MAYFHQNTGDSLAISFCPNIVGHLTVDLSFQVRTSPASEKEQLDEVASIISNEYSGQAGRNAHDESMSCSFIYNSYAQLVNVKIVNQIFCPTFHDS